ncbi:MAG: NADH-quinone oxidoreductase subunit A [Armatimonadota bacterium]|nr:NADH-quinone oxidoreductase subunit A [Armatimonadota bacterium]MDR7455068.1 NADH-quinone oxidoreductase subunit A [Armatimonadota bacterium]MDR7495446.1 NADH-quinone oxidoreductase subunit A [Armatimonadota bacterium]MDR7510873.1 NADH-quinone oxidoreductase subunit A [Armatimonadota bacterium]
MLLVDWLYVGVFLVVGLAMAALPLAVVWALAPRLAQPQKRTTYESGVVPFGQAWAQFNVRYYLFSLVFVIFDVEVIYLYPWSIVFRQYGRYAFFVMLIFVGILLLGLIHAWRKGALEWT